jgi:hypothetical protein
VAHACVNKLILISSVILSPASTIRAPEGFMTGWRRIISLEFAQGYSRHNFTSYTLSPILASD